MRFAPILPQIILLSTLLFVVSARTALAQSLSSSVTGLYKTSQGATASFNESTVTTSLLNRTGQASNGFSTASAGGTARAQTDYGTNKAFARSTVVADPNVATAEAESKGISTWTDQLTINKDGLEGTTAKITYSFSVHGTIAGNIVSTARAERSFNVLHDGTNVGKLTDSLSNGEQTETLITTPFTITYGQPFTLSVSLQAYAYRFENITDTPVFSRADYSNTAIFTGMAVTDLADNPVTGATYSATSGTNTYNLAGGGPAAVVPEVGSFLYLGLGLISSGLIRRKK